MRPEKVARAVSTSADTMALESPTGCGSASASSVSVTKPRWMSATYVFGRRRANSARRVADSKRIGSTPVASGSSVPAWPTRCAPVRRRRRLTTANEVSPALLSTFRTPTEKAAASAFRCGGNDRLLGRRQHKLHGLIHRLIDLRARGTNVPSASKDRAHRGGIDATAAPHADFRELGADLFEQDGQLQAGDAVERVDDAL